MSCWILASIGNSGSVSCWILASIGNSGGASEFSSPMYKLSSSQCGFAFSSSSISFLFVAISSARAMNCTTGLLLNSFLHFLFSLISSLVGFSFFSKLGLHLGFSQLLERVSNQALFPIPIRTAPAFSCTSRVLLRRFGAFLDVFELLIEANFRVLGVFRRLPERRLMGGIGFGGFWNQFPKVLKLIDPISEIKV